MAAYDHRFMTPRPSMAQGRLSPRGRTVLRVCLFLLLLLAGVTTSDGFVPLTMEPTYGSAVGLAKRWDLDALPDGRIPYWINLSRPPGATPVGPNASPDQIINHIRNAFQTWENISTARVRFRYMGTTTATNGFDGMNVVTFSPKGVNFAPVQPVLPLGWYAKQAGRYGAAGGKVIVARFPGQVLDCDIVINPQLQGFYTVSDEGNLKPRRDYDLEGYIVHELGHALGLDHTNTGADAAMNINFTPHGGFTFRNLSTDDMIGISALYPREGFLESRGSISGTVRRPDGSPVFGAHVVAMDAQTGVIVTSTSTGLSEVYPDGTPKRLSLGVGDYRLVGLPPGIYRIYAEPLDGPDADVQSGVFWSRDFRQQLMETDFTPAFFTGNLTVRANDLIAGVDITVGTRTPSAPNLSILNYIAEPGRPFTDLALARPGTEPTFAMPTGENLESAYNLRSGTRFEFPGQGVTIQSADLQPGAFIFLRLRIAPGAPYGPRLLEATTPDGPSFMSGGVIVVPPPPIIRSVATVVSPAGTTALIDGENFAATSLPIVLINGQMAADLVVESATRLRATMPAGTIGAAEARVITLAGVASFSFVAPAS